MEKKFLIEIKKIEENQRRIKMIYLDKKNFQNVFVDLIIKKDLFVCLSKKIFCSKICSLSNFVSKIKRNSF
jgi:hypothetical protein